MMSEQEFADFVKAAEEFTREVTANAKIARSVLVEEGIYQPDGELADEYR